MDLKIVTQVSIAVGTNKKTSFSCPSLSKAFSLNCLSFKLNTGEAFI